ncbi:hypothetical protein CsSME_00020720 [Camellia sinensis var. sinensis]
MARFLCPGKVSWPELLGADGETAAATIEKENSLVKAVILLKGSPITDDFVCTRVRVFVDKSGIVVLVPKAG